MSTACTAPNQAGRPSSNLHSESHVGTTTCLILPFLVLNSPLAKQRSLVFCSPQSISSCMYLPIDHQRKYDGMVTCAEESGKSFLNMTSRQGRQLDPSYLAGPCLFHHALIFRSYCLSEPSAKHVMMCRPPGKRATPVLPSGYPRLTTNGMMNEQMGSNMIVNVCDPFFILNSHRSRKRMMNHDSYFLASHSLN